MIIIKVMSQDVYVAAEVSENYTHILEKELGLLPHSVMFVGGDSTLIVGGIEQVSWFTYLEISLPRDLEKDKDIIVDILHEAFQNYGVHVMMKFSYYDRADLITLANEDYPLFNATVVEVSPLDHPQHDDDDEDDEEEDE